MKSSHTSRLAMIALPLTLSAGIATAGGIAEPVMTPAPAAPVAVMAPAPVMSGDWGGFYAGASIGYGQASGDNNGTDVFGNDPDGALYGVHAGYNYDFGTFVLGGELEYQATDLTDDATDVSIDGIARAKIRAGYDAGNFMPYLAAGAAQGYLNDGGTDVDDTGYFYGAGVDYKVGQNVVVGAEILQHKFDDFNDSGTDLDATSASLRVSYKF